MTAAMSPIAKVSPKPAATTASSPRVPSARTGSAFRALLGKPVDRAPLPRATPHVAPPRELATRLPSARGHGPDAPSARATTPSTSPSTEASPLVREPAPAPSLEPFRVMPALSPVPERPVPRLPDEAVLALAGDLVEALRVGRVRDGHAVSFRLRRAEGTVGVELSDVGGVLRMRLDGADDRATAALGERVAQALRERGLELELE